MILFLVTVLAAVSSINAQTLTTRPVETSASSVVTSALSVETFASSVVTSTSSVVTSTSSAETSASPVPTKSKWSDYRPIKLDRDAGVLTFFPYTPEQRDTFVSNAENIFKASCHAWVNFDSKIKHHGQEANPFPGLKHIRDNIGTLTDKQLQLGLLDVFIRARDGHTSMVTAGPYSCFLATIGIDFGFVDGPGDVIKDPTIIVKEPVNEKILKQLSNTTYSQINVGDQLLSINGLNFYNWQIKNRNAIGGYSEASSQRQGLEYLTSRSGSHAPLPDEDSIKLKFKSRNGTIYEVDAPYMSAYRRTCWEYSSQLYKNLTGVTLSMDPHNTAAVDTNDHASSVKITDDHATSFKLDMSLRIPRNSQKQDQNSQYQDVGRLSKRDSQITFHETDILELSWAIWNPNEQNMGIIKLESFRSTLRATNVPGIPEGVLEVRKLLTTVLKDTKSVLIDVREGGGGAMGFSSGIPQLFKADFQPFKATYLMNNVTYNMFVNPPIDLETSRDAWSKTPPGSKYSVLHDLIDPKSANDYGQVYTKPMGVFTTGDCFSACEVMTGSVQSSGVGTVFGEDSTTGGGGANVWILDPELINFDPIDFKPMPFKKELTPDATDAFYNRMTLGHRALVRNGKHNGQWIEDIGIVSDFVVRPKLEDVLSGEHSNSQYNFIADHLDKIGQKTGQNKLKFLAEPFNIEAVLGAGNITVDIDGFTSIQLFAQDKPLTDKIALSPGHHNIQLPANSSQQDIGNSVVTIIAKNDKHELKTHRNIRTIPKLSDYINIAKPWTFAGPNQSVGIYNSPLTPSGNGWNSVNGTWVTGNGTQYASMVDTMLEAFFFAEVGSRINIEYDFSIKTEETFDFLYLYAYSNGEAESLLNTPGQPGQPDTYGVSGTKDEPNGKVQFTTKSKYFSVGFKFKSDGAVQDIGPVIKSWKISLA
ncbi:hypothetical protein BATDEDRAFT_24985 [Batrachochytrium dendrobatidis JAM81]|uniref:Tail specific protease domain-containing protein n=1 Tax=Batrachochytrium dendrobatidis (strain JAM81 / FGSC 10211) TaxID=684364 RepID=F4P354_BATDJ|nr:uncharacterized protein BATDEDRAFT_24985 [Batrachochytrium dendrobatidis JAM81]EGF80421.1 hypothetical protein BATDEDRAFT_24985 [Batrachochytrium dendrobatidis JAM81]|eukprot:XP_006678979.1 hypothetical protein BATDEDRAFT_24985 [Batrachochytrium dendrobatidis JAM81]